MEIDKMLIKLTKMQKIDTKKIKKNMKNKS